MRTLAMLLCLAVLSVGVAQAVPIDGVDVPGGTPLDPIPTDPIDRHDTDVLIDFDDVEAPCSFSDQYPLGDEYVDLGVEFAGPAEGDGGAILNECGNFGVSGHSAPNFVAFNWDATMANGGTPTGSEYIYFTEPVNYVSVLVGSGSGAGATLSMRAYDSDGVLIAETSVVLAPVLQEIAVEACPIATVVIGDLQPRVWVFDDLGFSFGGTPVEAETWGAIKALFN